MSLSQNPYVASNEATDETEEPSPLLARVGVVIAAIANIGAILAWLPILRIKTGSTVRPMMEGAISMLFVAFGLVVVLPVCVLAMRRHKLHRLSAGIGLVFALLPFPLSSITLQLIASMRGITILE